MEIGIVGLVGFLLIYGGAILVLERARRKAPEAAMADALLATELLLCALFYVNVVFNHTASSFAWSFFVAALAAVPTCTSTGANTNVPHQRKNGRFRRTRSAG